MMKRANKLWYDRCRLDDDDTLQEVKSYLTLLGYKNYHVMIYDGVESLVIDKGISSYMVVPNEMNMTLDLYKRDNLNLKKSDKWWKKKSFDDAGDWYLALKWISNGSNI